MNVSPRRWLVVYFAGIGVLAAGMTWAVNALDADPSVAALAILALIVVAALTGSRLELPPR